MMKRRIGCLFFIVFALVVAPNFAATATAADTDKAPVIIIMDAALATGSMPTLLEVMKPFPISNNDVNRQMVRWALDNKERLNAQVLFAIARRACANDKQEGVKLYFAARMWATYDAYRCVDKSARQAVPALASQSRETRAYLDDNPQEVVTGMEAALEWENDAPSPVHPAWICYHGISAYVTALEGDAQNVDEMVVAPNTWPNILKGIREYTRLRATSLADKQVSATEQTEVSETTGAPETEVTPEATSPEHVSESATNMNVEISLDHRVTLEHPYWINNIVWSPDGQYITSSSNFSIGDMVRDVTTGEIIVTAEKPYGGLGGIALSPDGRYLITSESVRATAENRYAATVWDIQSGEVVKHLVGPPAKYFGYAFSYAKFSPDGTLLIIPISEGAIAVYDTSSWELVRSFGEKINYLSAAIHPDAPYLAIGRTRGRVTIWNYLTGTVVKKYKAHSGAVEALAYSPDGAFLVTGCDNGVTTRDPATGLMVKLADDDMVRVWDMQDFSKVRSYYGPKTKSSINAVAFSPDGRFIAVDNSYRDDELHTQFVILDAVSMDIVKHIETDSSIQSLAFNPSGDALAASVNQSIVIWDIKTTQFEDTGP